MKRHLHWYAFLVLLLVGAFIIYFIYQNNQEKEEAALKQELEYVHNRAVNQFTSSVNKQASIVAGMRSFVNMSREFPSESQFQKFVQNQLDDINSKDSIVVSFIDTSHVFQQSFTRGQMNPVGLKGTSVKALRSEREIRDFNTLFHTDELLMYPPLNLAEGWLGIPINFRVYRGGKTLGYVAPILDFSSIISDVYDDEVISHFAFKFTTQDGYDFDRYQLYDGSKIFNERIDKEYYKNFNITEEEFISTRLLLYGNSITISTACKLLHGNNKDFMKLLGLCFLIYALTLFVLSWQAERSARLNEKLSKASKEIANQNIRLRELNTTQKKFFSIISHDLKQPLYAIQGLFNISEIRDTEDPILKAIFNGIKDSTQRSLNLLNNLLSWALSQTGQLESNLSEVDVRSLVNESIELVKAQADRKSVQIENQIDENLVLLADKNMSNTVIRNILTNAIKYSNSEGQVTISSKIFNDRIQIIIEDTGVGMTEKHQQLLFKNNPDAILEDTTGQRGSGLGLVLCKDFMEKQNGTIEVNSKEGAGTSFILTFIK